MRSIPIDAHAHYHDCYRLVEFLDGAAGNFQRAAATPACPDAPAGVLLLADIAGQNSLQTFTHAAANGSVGGWQFENTQEDCSLAAYREGQLKLVLISGRQIACAGGIELLALACNGEFPDGVPIRETLGAVRRQGGIPVLPWGFGKWWFRRGKVVRQLLQRQGNHGENGGREMFLGDSGGRLQLSWEPPLFETARRLGVRILPGSDPLPFPSQTAKVGRYGLVLQGTLDLHQHARQIKTLLANQIDQPPTYGRRERMAAFVRSQIAMQMQKRIAGTRP